jgi:hypothetical protein
MLFFKKSLDSHLNETKKIKVHGVYFKIKKINAMDHLQGYNTLQKIFDVYKVNNGKPPENRDKLDDLKKVKDYCRDIILAGVVTPKLSIKPDGSGYFVDEIFRDFALAQALTHEILKFTYKKKLNIL